MADFSDPAEYADLRAAVREITAAHGPAEFAEHARTATSQAALWSDLGNAGFIGINVPAEYGGGGAGMSELAIVAEEAAAGGCPLLLLLVSSAIGVEVLARHGSPEQKQEWLTQLADGGIKMAFAITEPDAGSNSHQITTTAVRDGADYLLTGSKYYISGVDESAAILTVARSGVDEHTGKAKLSLFIVRTDAAGLSWNVLPVAAQIPDKQFTVFYDQVRVPASALIGLEGEGLRPLFDGLNPERIASAALAVGVGRYAIDLAAAYAGTRQVWGTPIGTHQGVSHPLAKAKIAVELAALMTAKAAWQHDHGLPAGEASNMAKYA
ncbi:MAG: acyl-CoA/acyl-ACP dehydrogenase, partial [Actinomycetota bacterium]|nr:acyl-CoA/acyl-ACP dehydrogenase [Actinomycetota bacterium]